MLPNPPPPKKSSKQISEFELLSYRSLRLFMGTVIIFVIFFLVTTPRENWDMQHFVKIFDIRQYVKR